MPNTVNLASTTTKDQSILACIDGSNVSKSVCDYACWYATKLELPISLLHVIDVPKSTRHDLSGAIGLDSRRNLLRELATLDEKKARIANKHGEALLQDAKQHINHTHPNSIVHMHLRRSKLLAAIERHVEQSRVIILGRRGTDHQDKHMTIGSQIESVVRAVNRPILICSDEFVTPTSYLLAFDGSDTAKKAVTMLCDNKMTKNLKGYLVMVDHQDTTNENELYKAKLQMEKSGLQVSTHIIDSKVQDKNKQHDVVSLLINFQQRHNISMFVIGAYGHSKWRRFFVGSTTTKLLASTTAPVVLLR